MEPTELTETLIRRRASATIFARGQEYAQEGAVTSLVWKEPLLTATVAGSSRQPYRVVVRFGTSDMTESTCSCPYDNTYSGWCKHIVAVLLTCALTPEEIEVGEAFAPLWEQAEVAQLRRALALLVERHPELEAELSGLLASPRAQTSSKKSPGINVKAVRDRIRGEFRETARHNHYGDRTLSSLLSELTDDATLWLQQGDPDSALALLEVVSTEFIDDDAWVDFDHESDFDFGHLGVTWAEVLLDPALTEQARRASLPKLAHWQQQLNDYYGGDEFDLATEAAERGWTAPVLQGLLAGTLPSTFWGEGLRLTQIRLAILERRDQAAVALRVAQVAGLSAEATQIAIQLEQWETVEAEVERIKEPHQVLSLTQVLEDRGQSTLAFRVAVKELERCLVTPDHKYAVSSDQTSCYPLALWVRDRAAAEGDSHLAEKAASKAIYDRPNLADWLRLEEIAGERWPERRVNELVRLKEKTRYTSEGGQVDILLHEGCATNAWQLYKGSYDRVLIARIADVVVSELPADVAAVARHYAEEIMNSGSSGRYEEAQGWLKRVKNAMGILAQEDTWTTYYQSLLTAHTRKYKLMGLLRAL